MDINDVAQANLRALRENRYPGRGIVVGQSPDGQHLVEVYWIMGRSENSRNRIFVQEDDVVRTAPFDESKVEDPSLIIYNCIRTRRTAHIVTNGDQTDTIFQALEEGKSFEQALYTRTFEPDTPNYTPRIAALINLEDPRHAYQLGILKTLFNNEAYPVRHVYNYAAAIPGVGHFIATYDGDGDPLPSFTGEPRPLPLTNDPDETLDLYWDALDEDNKVSLLVKSIDPIANESAVEIVNKNIA
ncbi:MAG: IMP cyclohydrolase [Planctomycetes bacterium]|nr:IMP cyclohydrolase [Planctomycetota bacterium]